MEENKLAIIRISEEHVIKFLDTLDTYMDSTDHEYLIAKLQELCYENQVDKFIDETKTTEQTKKEENFIKYIIDGLLFVPKGILLGTGEIMQRADTIISGNKKDKEGVKEIITLYKNRFSINELILRLTNLNDLEARINELMFDNFLNPIEADLKQIIENQEGREKQLTEAQAKLESLQKQKKEYEEKRATMVL